MYKNRKWQIAARNRRFKAILYAFAFHLVLIAGIVYSSDSNLKDMIPEIVKEWVNNSDENPGKKKGGQPKA